MSLTGDAFKAVRVGLKESQAAFADRFGVNQATISRWETEGPPNDGIAGALIDRVLGEIGSESRRRRAPAEARA